MRQGAFAPFTLGGSRQQSTAAEEKKESRYRRYTGKTACGLRRRSSARSRAASDGLASGGRRSEVAGLRVEDLVEEEPVRTNPTDEHSPLLPCLTIRLGRTKTTSADDNEHVVLIGRPVTALRHWATETKIEAGPVFLHTGYITEAANRGIPLPEAMQQSLHKSVTQSSGYYNNPERKMGRPARMLV
ncbi:hypothetical protein A6U97_25680 [Agrobacterium tumefaciens]|nr:hypothetical protein A6U97_25680 [Agrobacterium tumefaciens]